MSVDVDIKALLEAGVHFGHKTSRWHPKMAPYIHSKRQESHIIDLTKTVEALNKALPELTKIAASGKKVLFVGTKKQAKDIVREAAEKIGQPYVTERWIGGMLTNSQTITQQIKKLKNLEKRMTSGDLEKRYSKLEVQRFQEEIDVLNTRYGGIKDLMGKPGAVVVVDAAVDANAVREAKVLGVPVEKLRSGPLGGDQQIGARIAEGEVDFILFFWDPLEPQPHDPDVKALLRIAVVWNVPVACNRASADFMISSPLMASAYQRALPDFDAHVRRFEDTVL